MNNSQRFTAAHKIARETVALVGDYRVAFSIALKGTYMETRTTAEKLIELGGREWKKGAHHRVYITGDVAVEFFNTEHAYFGKSQDAFYNVVTNEFFSTNRRTNSNLNCLLEEM